MVDKTLIKELAKFIVKQNPVNKIATACSSLIGESDYAAKDCYEALARIEDGFMGRSNWMFTITVTPETAVDDYYVGMVNDIIGVEDCKVECVEFDEDDDTHVVFTDEENRLLEEELLRLWS